MGGYQSVETEVPSAVLRGRMESLQPNGLHANSHSKTLQMDTANRSEGEHMQVVKPKVNKDTNDMQLDVGGSKSDDNAQSGIIERICSTNDR